MSALQASGSDGAAGAASSTTTSTSRGGSYKERVSFAEIMRPLLGNAADGSEGSQAGRWASGSRSGAEGQLQQQQPSRARATTAASSLLSGAAASFPFGPTRLPLLPDAVRGFELPEVKDPLFFLEWCPVRGVGACVAGGVMGLLFGAIFSGYNSLQPYDPALRDWQNAQAKGMAGLPPAGGAAGAAARTAPAASVLGPTYIPGYNAPVVGAAGAGAAAGAASGSAAAAGAARGAAGAAAGGSAVATAEGIAASALPASHPTFGPTGAFGSGAVTAAGEVAAVPLAQAFKEGLVNMKNNGVSSARNFAIMGGIYTTCECALEQIRAKKDIHNAVGAGFCTGAILAARAGPAAIMFGGAGFAAFSAVIEVLSPYIFDHQAWQVIEVLSPYIFDHQAWQGIEVLSPYIFDH